MGRVTPPCAIFAASEDIAEQYLDAFGLSREIWATFRHDAAVTGRQFDRIVVIRPHWQMDAEEITRFENVTVDHWMPRLVSGGNFKII
jgi:hypothetical protein